MMINNFANSYGMFPMMGLGAGLFTVGAFLFLLLILVVIALKGYALWHAAKRDEKGWFIALLLVNTFGILELIYLYFIVGKWKAPKNTNAPPPESPHL
ncbi:MAG TPA: DUF5652 family protein [Candidatus Paceibacterota bacterium]